MAPSTYLIIAIIVILAAVLVIGAPKKSINTDSAITGAMAEEFKAQGNTNFVSDELIVKFKPGLDKVAQRKILSSYGLSTKREITQLNLRVVRVPAESLDEVRLALAKNKKIEYVEKNLILPPAAEPNDPKYVGGNWFNRWHITNTETNWAWNTSKGDGVTIAILDAGWRSHPDLVNKMVPGGYNFYLHNNNITSDSCQHGTMVAGSAAAETNNALGVASVGWNAGILPLKITMENCYGSATAISEALVYAADRGVKVASISFRIVEEWPSLKDASAYFKSRGGTIVAAAGNDGIFYNLPDMPNIISVTSYDSNNVSINGRNYGPFVDLSGPDPVMTTWTIVSSNGTVTYTYNFAGGSSFSTPAVAGIVALLYSPNPNATPDMIANALENTATDITLRQGSNGTFSIPVGYDIYSGWGRVNASKAIQRILDVTPPTPDTTPPSASITEPQDGATVFGYVPVNVDSSDDVGVERVELYADGSLVGTDYIAPYSFVWDANGLTGSHSLQAKSYDAAGNVGTSQQVSVTIQSQTDTTPPTVLITNPPNGSTVTGIVTIRVNVSDASGIERVDFFIDNKLKSSDYSSPYTYTWNTKSVKPGNHPIIVKAYDIWGNIGIASITVTKVK